MKVFLQSIFGQLLMTPYICWRGYQALPAKKSWRIPYLLFFFIELAVFFTGFFFRKTLPDEVMILIYYFCNTWYIASIYLSISLLFLDILRLLNRIRPWYPYWVKTYWKEIKLGLFFTILTGIIGLMVHAYYNVGHPTVRHISLSVSKGESTRDSLTIVMMSDLHIGEMIGKKQVQRFVKLSNKQQPDMVVIVGDIIDYESRFAEQQHIEEDLQQLQAPLGVYMVNGNHEYRANRFAKQRWFQKTGATLLVDSIITPDSTFYLVGRDDKVNRRREPLSTLLVGIDRDKPVIVLDHQPWDINEMVMHDIDLGLHGHTHNGQLWPYSLLLGLIYEVSYGYYQKGLSQFYVSSGVGIAGPPYRIGTVSEIVVIHIRFI